MTGLLCTIAFFAGMAFLRWLDRLEKNARPEITEWGESTRFWSDTDWEWYHSGGDPGERP